MADLQHGEDNMSVTVSQGLAGNEAAAIAATRIRWTHIAPTLLIVWIVSMFDKSNISLVMADSNFLDELQLAGQPVKLGWLVYDYPPIAEIRTGRSQTLRPDRAVGAARPTYAFSHLHPRRLLEGFDLLQSRVGARCEGRQGMGRRYKDSSPKPP